MYEGVSNRYFRNSFDSSDPIRESSCSGKWAVKSGLINWSSPPNLFKVLSFTFSFPVWTMGETVLFSFQFVFPGMPGAGSQYSVMGRPQDPRSSMFGSSINLNGEFRSLLSRSCAFINHNGIELPRRNHILILLKGKWECCAGKPRAKEQHSEGCWHNTPSVDSFNSQTPHIVNNIIFLVMITADTFPHISTWIPQSCSPHPWVLRINSSGEVSGINSLLKLFLALICPNSGNWTWRGVLSREPWVHSPN